MERLLRDLQSQQPGLSPQLAWLFSRRVTERPPHNPSFPMGTDTDVPVAFGCVWMLLLKGLEMENSWELHRLQALGVPWKQNIIYVGRSQTDLAKSST